jgi:hypothetical protein
MRRALPALLLSACAGLDPDGIELAPPCAGQAILDLHPKNGAAAVYGGAPIWAELRCPATDGTLSVTAGEAVPGAVSASLAERRFVFVPDAPLPEGPAAARVETGAGFRDWSWEVSAVGVPVGDISGRALGLRLGESGLLRPAPLRAELDPLLDALFPAVQVLGNGGATVPVRVGLRDGSDPAAAPSSEPVFDADATWADPLLSVPIADWTWHGDGAALHLVEAVLTVAFGTADNGAGVSLIGTLDLRGTGLDEEAACVSSEAGGGDRCFACADDEPFCLPFALYDVRAIHWDGSFPAPD